MKSNSQFHIPISTESGVVWDFMIPVEATTCSEQTKELEEVIKNLFRGFGDFIAPIEIEYGIAIYSVDITSPFGDNNPEPKDIIRRNIQNESGITISELISSMNIKYDNSRFISRVPINHNRIKIRTKGEDRYIDRTDCVAYAKGKPVNRTPSWDPINLVVKITPNTQNDSIRSDYIIHTEVSLLSNIWVKQTPLGEKNREYLSTFLHRLYDNIPAKTIQREVYTASDFWYDLNISNLADKFDPSDVF